jgi:hypothetical protein
LRFTYKPHYLNGVTIGFSTTTSQVSNRSVKYLVSHYIVGNIMRALVKVDEKGRIQVPTKFRRVFKMKPKGIVNNKMPYSS